MAQSNSLTRGIFAKLTPHEFLLANLQPGEGGQKPSRTNGRAPPQSRRPQIHTGSLSHAHGSAIVRNGDTTVICGVRGEILPVTSIPHYRPRSRLDRADAAFAAADGRRELRDYDLVVPNIELATGSAPQFLPGVPPTPLAQTLSTRVYSLLHSCRLLDIDDLRIWYTPPSARRSGGDEMEQEEEDGDEQEPQIKAYWTLYIDLLFISFDGNPFDAAWVAVLAALRDTKLPAAAWDADREMVLCSRQSPRLLNVTGWPIACTAAVLLEKDQGTRGKHWFLLDPDRLEESLCAEAVTVVVDRTWGETKVRSISKSGGVVIDADFMKRFMRVAEERWYDFRKALDQKKDGQVVLS